MQYFDRSQVMELLDMAGCIGLMRDTLIDYSTNQTIQVLRTAMPLAPRKVLGVMPAGNTHRGITGAKIITVFHDNFQRGLPSHQGIVVVLDLDTGALKTILDADSITGIRTAAVSAAATDALARKDAHVLCVLGSGLQARRHVEAMCLIRKIDEIRVWDISRESVKRFKAEMEEIYGVPVHDCCDDVQKAVEGADIICTVTAAHDPILFGAHVSSGAHINAVGACGAAFRELDTEAVAKARFFCDSRESCMNEAGDLLIPIRTGELTEDHLLGEIGLVLNGTLAGRLSDEDITIFEAQGLAVEDLASADYVYQKFCAKEENK